MNKNVITITQSRDGFTATARATFDESAEGGWLCELLSHCTQGDIRESSDPFAELQDMLDYELTVLRQQEAFNAGPYSNAQCRS